MRTSLCVALVVYYLPIVTYKRKGTNVNIAVWIISGIFAAFFLLAGFTKLAGTREKLITQLPWSADMTLRTVRLIGAVEILGAIGLILPEVTGIAPILTPLAAVGLAVVMVLASTVHIRRGETQGVVTNVIVCVAMIFVAVARFAGV